MVDTSNLPIGTKTPPTVEVPSTPALPEVIVSAAIMNRTGSVICGARHYDRFMHEQLDTTSGDWGRKDIVQGFITNKNRFVDRVEGLAIATAQKQIKRMVGGGDVRLYSEMLY